ncbi:MAG: hypothetical protein ABUS79_03310 [Pseudomonadota bacterium]
MAFAVGCFPEANDLRRGARGGRAGTGGLPATGSGGGAVGSGGSTASGGRPGTGGQPGTGGNVGVGTGGYTGDGTAIVPSATGVIDRRGNAYGIEGGWYALSDGAGSDGRTATGDCEMAGHPMSACSAVTAPPHGSFPNTAGRMCVTGTLAVVSNHPTTGMPDWEHIWGVTMGFDLNNTPGAAVPQPFNAAAKGITGFSFDIDRIPPWGLRVAVTTPATQFSAPAYWGAMPDYPPSPVVVGTNRVRWSNITHPMTGAGVDATMLTSVHFGVPPDSSASAPFAFCISNVKVTTTP